MKTPITIALLLVAASAFGQTATIATPIVPLTQTTLVVGTLIEGRANPDVGGSAPYATVTLWVLDSGGHIADQWTIQMSGNTEVLAFERARSTAVSGENTFTMQNQRILVYLKANCTTFTQPCTGAAAAAITGATITP